MKPKSLIVVVLVIFLLTAVTSAFAAEVIFDAFDGAQEIELTAPGTDFNVQSWAGSNVLGDTRDLVLTYGEGTGSLIIRTAATTAHQLVFESFGPVGTGQVTWDGDLISGNLGHALGGASGIDMTEGNTVDSFTMVMDVSLQPVLITFSAYSNSGANCSSYSFVTPGDITTVTDTQVHFVIPFNQFTMIDGCTSGVDWPAVQSVRMDMEIFHGGDSKIRVDFLKTTNARDHGDLPEIYGDAIHAPLGLRLGTQVDIEEVANYSDDAMGDNFSGTTVPVISDEDGVTPDSPLGEWTTLTGGQIQVTVNGCPEVCYLAGWFDLNRNGIFDVNERLLTDVEVSNGDNLLSFALPFDPTGITNIRFRLYESLQEDPQPIGVVLNGEVEDYQWDLTPTALVITGLAAQTATLPLILAGVLVAGALLGLTYLRLRK